MACPRLQMACSGSTRGIRRDPLANLFAQRRRQILNRDTLLLHRIAVAQRYRLTGRERRRADLMPPVDRLRLDRSNILQNAAIGADEC